jgi:hypothetical protein
MEMEWYSYSYGMLQMWLCSNNLLSPVQEMSNKLTPLFQAKREESECIVYWQSKNTAQNVTRVGLLRSEIRQIIFNFICTLEEVASTLNTERTLSYCFCLDDSDLCLYSLDVLISTEVDIYW